MRKNSRVIALLFAVMVGVTGCGIGNINSNESESDENTQMIDITLPASEAAMTEVIAVGMSKVYLDEVRYYAYNTQATYETYYNVEGKELIWDSIIEEGITLELAVKSKLLDSICEREVIADYADEYNVAFTEEEIMDITSKTEKFYADSNKELLNRMDVKKERLKEIFAKDELYKKVSEAMEKEEKGKTDEVYKNWKKVNNVTTNEFWDALNFNKPIFNTQK